MHARVETGGYANLHSCLEVRITSAMLIMTKAPCLARRMAI